MMSKYAARIFGVCFVLSFLSYATGMSLTEVVQNVHTQPDDILLQKNSLIVGTLLISVFHTLFNAGLLAAMYGVLKPISKTLSGFYLSAGLVSTMMLALGGICLALAIPASEWLVKSVHNHSVDLSFFLSLLTKANFYLYQAGMAIWAVGGLTLCYLLHQSRFVPAALPYAGIVGYLIFITGTLLELSDYPIGVILSIPGGLFEIILSGWLIIRSFRKSGTH